MGDAELQAIRQRRMAELAAQNGAASPQNFNSNDQQSAAEAASKRQEEEEQRRQIMTQLLDGKARERLSRIALVRPERERGIQDLLIRMARSGQIRGKVTDEQLLSVLEQVTAAEGGQSEQSRITFNRKGARDDSDDSEDERPSKAAGSRKQDDDDDDVFDL